jgi:uncharacterized protein with ParB-like and HNH nuclease domain
MKAKEKRFLHFLEGSDKHFVIPVYQRNYDWSKTQCEQLFDDLIDISKKDKTHFLGSIVSIYNDSGKDREYLIIDGQQRLTTLSLLLLAIYKIIDKNLMETNTNKEKIRDEYLINKYSDDDKKIRLKPIKNDRESFSLLFKEQEDYVDNNNIIVNFKYFYNRVLDKKISIDDLFFAIQQLVIVEIELINGEDDPQLIFESLNSTGLDLTEADKVRNFILMKENSSTQEKFYNEYWNKIEKNTNYNVSDFIRDYLTIRERSIPNKRQVYLHFKKYVIKNVINIEDLLADLLQFSTYYKKIINSNGDNDNTNLLLQKINKLENVVSYPFIMEVLDDEYNGKISQNTINEILEIIISFVFRRLICSVATNALNKIFMTMGKEIKKYDDYQENYLEIFKYIITGKKLSQRFPDDSEFSLNIMQKDIYNLKGKNKTFLFEQLENFKNTEKVDIENLLSKNSLNIEHIMPQTLNAKWRSYLGVDYEIVHSKYLHTLGNLTLTGYNSQMSNKLFVEKRDMDKGFKESRLFLNKFLHNVECWNIKSINSRAKLLKDRSLKIWKYPISSYKTQEQGLKLFTLDSEDMVFKGEKVISFQFMNGTTKKIGSWKEFYTNVLSILYDLDPIKLKQILNNNKYLYNKDSSNTKIDKHIKISDIYIYGILETEELLSRIRSIIKDIDLDLDDIVFEIK